MDDTKKKSFCWKRFCFFSAEFGFGMFAFFAALISIFMWRLSTSPLDLAFAKNFVEEQLTFEKHDVYVDINQLILHWPDRSGPLLLGIRDAVITDSKGHQVVSVGKVGIGLSISHLFIGEFRPTTLVIDRPVMNINRSKSGQFSLNVGAETSEEAVQPVESDDSPNIFMRILSNVENPDDQEDGSPMAALEEFEIKNAVVTVEDEFLDETWSVPRVNAVFHAQNGGMKAEVSVYLDSAVETPHLRFEASVPHQSDVIESHIILDEFPLAYVGEKIEGANTLSVQDVSFDGVVRGRFSRELAPLDVTLDLSANRGALIVPAYKQDAFGFKDFSIRAAYEEGGETLKIKDLFLQADDGAGGFVPIEIQADAKQIEKRYEIDAKLNIPQMHQNQFEPLWPDSLKEENAYDWLTAKLSDGVFDGITFDAMAVLDLNGEEVEGDLQSLVARFGYSDMTIDYRSPMTPITEAQGRGYFDYTSEILRIGVDQASVGPLTMRHGQVELTYIIAGGQGHADIYTGLEGSLADMLAFLEKKPINFEHGYDLSRVQGQGSVNVTVGLPTYGNITLDDAVILVRGDVKNAVVPDLLQKRDLTSANAKLVIEDNAVTLKGNGEYLQTPVNYTYNGFLTSKDRPYKEKITFSASVNETVRNHFNIDLSTFLAGSVGVNGIYVNRGAGQQIDAKLDLTNSRIFVDPFQYNKLPGVAAQGTMQVYMQGENVEEIDNLRVTGPELDIAGGRLIFDNNVLKQGEAASVVLGATKGRVNFEVPTPDHYKVTADLDVFDLRPLKDPPEDAPKNTEGPGFRIESSIKAASVLTFQDKSVRQGQMFADIEPSGRFAQLEFDALAGIGDIYLRYKPDANGQKTFRFEAGDAGATLAAFGLYDKMRGGKILVHAEPVAGHSAIDGNLVGVAEITDFEVFDAPTLAKILSLMSLDGVANGLGNTGIAFKRLESKFDWLYRQEGSLLTLQEGRTSGAAVGLTFDGVIDQALGTIEVNGTIIPVSEVNKLIRSIPLLGEILTGGTGVFAATYSIEGKTSEPKVSVNPLSVLAPGIIRRILFE